MQQTTKKLSRYQHLLPKRLGVIAITGLVMSLLWLRQQAARTQAVSVDAGMSAPDFSLSSAQGDTYHLSDLQDRVVLLSFINTQPLDTSLSTPDMSRSQIVCLKSIMQQYAVKGVQVLLVDATALVQGQPPGRSSLLDFVHNWDMETIPILIDSMRIAQAYSVFQVPTTFLIAPDGRVTQRWDSLATAARLSFAVQSLIEVPDADAMPVSQSVSVEGNW